MRNRREIAEGKLVNSSIISTTSRIKERKKQEEERRRGREGRRGWVMVNGKGKGKGKEIRRDDLYVVVCSWLVWFEMNVVFEVKG